MPLPRKTLILIAKWLIAILVAIGLTWAASKAVDQWQEQKQIVQTAIAELDQSIEAESDPPRRRDLQQRRDALAASLPSLENLRWIRILLAAVLYAIGIVLPGFVLQQALRSLGDNPRLSTSVAAQLIGHAGKYVPGKAMVIVLRAGALSRDKVSPVRATVAVFMETLLMMAVGATVACFVICWLDVPTWMIGSATGVAVAASVPTIPPIITRIAARFAKTDTSQINSETTSGHLATKYFLFGWVFSLASWILIGASFTALVTAIPFVPDLDANVSAVDPPTLLMLYTVSTAAIALAMVVGFGSLLPGGAGVRELVLTTILATAVGVAHALLAAIAARLMFIVVEAICAAIAWYWLRRQSR
ncbi:lysylphosphatidylglycerol synthase domain-containing protein [Planctomycetes bacterium K23_9]|uniref:Lysylphosphatidylglycerol synthase TM region n=1 Tax=Stieleria marina TaxID=1930275 RepID=A0A517NSW9_9BACT|nr:hypothetical protein K239x_21650 [Planctomycetes bacterium K23_9]